MSTTSLAREAFTPCPDHMGAACIPDVRIPCVEVITYGNGVKANRYTYEPCGACLEGTEVKANALATDWASRSHNGRSPTYSAGFTPAWSSCCVCGLTSHGLWCDRCLAPLIRAGEEFTPSITVTLAPPEDNAVSVLREDRKNWRSSWTKPKVLKKQLDARERLLAAVS